MSKKISIISNTHELKGSVCTGLILTDSCKEPGNMGSNTVSVPTSEATFYGPSLQQQSGPETSDSHTESLGSRILDRKAMQLESTVSFLLSVLSSIAEFRDLESGNHVKRIQKYTNILIHSVMEHYPEYNLTENDCELIVQASALHDIGKIQVPDYILTKPEKLTAEEFAEIKKHTIYGCELLTRFCSNKDKFYQYSYEICRYHHERWDGKGYPDRLIGDEIPIYAQVVSVADVYDALVNKKVYRGAIEKEKAEFMIINGNCGTFNPKIIDCFKSSLDSFGQVGDVPVRI